MAHQHTEYTKVKPLNLWEKENTKVARKEWTWKGLNGRKVVKSLHWSDLSGQVTNYRWPHCLLITITYQCPQVIIFLKSIWLDFVLTNMKSPSHSRARGKPPSPPDREPLCNCLCFTFKCLKAKFYAIDKYTVEQEVSPPQPRWQGPPL